MDTACYKCEGTGFIEKYEWFKGGICFECEGTGVYKKRKKHKTTYHISDRKINSFNSYLNDSSSRQALGVGLYITTKSNVERWKQALGNPTRNNVVELDTSEMTFVSLKDIPKDRAVLAREITKHFKNSSEAVKFIKSFMPLGKTYDTDPFMLAQFTAWSKLNGFDGIYSWDKEEGEEIAIFNVDKLKVQGNINYNDFIMEEN